MAGLYLLCEFWKDYNGGEGRMFREYDFHCLQATSERRHEDFGNVNVFQLCLQSFSLEPSLLCQRSVNVVRTLPDSNQFFENAPISLDSLARSIQIALAVAYQENTLSRSFHLACFITAQVIKAN
mmetsp:Transcript_8950/g.17294  ORF Transcript_8950/g.17294 Transcript_8950/m.17294 type:complete len:125 (-) Transcript_8950:8-382(-)